MAIKAVTFDFWDTIVDDDSDEPKRAAKGLRSKRDERRHHLEQREAGLSPTLGVRPMNHGVSKRFQRMSSELCTDRMRGDAEASSPVTPTSAP